MAGIVQQRPRARTAGARARDRVARCLGICLAAVALTSVAAVPAYAIDIDGSHAGPVFQGVGGMSVAGSTKLLFDYPRTEQTEILDYLFCSPQVSAASGFCAGGRWGAALQRLKVEIGGETNAEVGAEPTIERTRGTVDCSVGWEFRLMRAARDRNPNIKLDALAWGYPGWINPSGSTDWARVFSQDTIDYLLHYVDCADRNGTPLDTLGIWNEKDYLGAARTLSTQWVASLRSALDRAGYSSVKLVSDDNFGYKPMAICGAPASADDRAYCGAIDYFSNHYPGMLQAQPPLQWESQANIWSAPGYEGTWTISQNAGSSASFTFTGTSIQWIGDTQWNMGKADVYVDGRLVGNDIDLYSPYNDSGGSPPEGGHYKQVLFSQTGMSNTTHTITVVATGEKNASSGGIYINVDAFAIDGTPVHGDGPCAVRLCVDDHDPRIAYIASKPQIATEDAPGLYDVTGGIDFYSNPLLRGDWAGARYLAQKLNTNYIEGGVTTGMNHYTLTSSYYDQAQYAKGGILTADTPWKTVGPKYKLQSRVSVMAHLTHFTQPGTWRYVGNSQLSTASCYLGTASCNSGSGATGSYVTLREIGGSSYAIVAETKDAARSQSLTFCLRGGLSTGTVHVWRTDSSSGMTNVANLAPSGGCFSHTLAADAVYTFTNQTTGQAGTVTSGFTETGLPLPYDETFQSYGSTQGQPQYFIDQFGAFETGHACPTGGATWCLRQVTPTRPINWAIYRDKPYTIVGDQTWSNYEVQTHANASVGETVSLMGRIQRSINDGDWTGRARYEAVMTRTGTTTWSWNLYRVDANHAYTSLRSGRVTGSAWITAKLVMTSTAVQLRLYASTVGTVLDRTYSAGLAGLATSASGASTFDRAYFDRFCVQAVGDATCPVA